MFKKTYIIEINENLIVYSLFSPFWTSPSKWLFILWFCTDHVDEFVRIDNKYCAESYGTYNTTEEAKEVCRKDVDCKYVFDDDCDGVDLKLCSISAEFDTSCPEGCEKPACTYIKGIRGLSTFLDYIKSCMINIKLAIYKTITYFVF